MQNDINDDTEDFLEHFGVKGMRWGRRSADNGGSAAASTHRKASEVVTKAKDKYNGFSKNEKKVTVVGAGAAATVALFGVGAAATAAVGAAAVVGVMAASGNKSAQGLVKDGSTATKNAAQKGRDYLKQRYPND